MGEVVKQTKADELSKNRSSAYANALISNPQEDSYDVFTVSGRIIDIPLETMMAIEGDANSRIIKFRLPRYFNGVDLSEKDVRVGYSIEVTGVKSYSVIENKEIGINDIIVRWSLPEEVTQEATKVKIKIEFYDGVNVSNYRWQTDTATFEIAKGISTFSNADEANYNYEVIFYEQNGGNTTFYSEYNSYEEPIRIEKRDLKIPVNFDRVLIQHDTRSRIIPFVMPRYYDGIDIADVKRAIAIKFFRTDGKGDLAPASNISVEAETVSFTWLVTGKATFIPGVLNVAIEVVGKNEIEERYVMSTHYTDEFEVIENLKVDEGLAEPEDSWLESWRVDAEILLKNARDSYEQLALEIGDLKDDTILTVNNSLMEINEAINKSNLSSNTANQNALLADQKANLANTAANNANTKATLADQKATLANTAATTANTIADQLKKETLLIYQAPVQEYANIATTYPTPALGWCVTVKSTGEQYRYNGTTWKLIGVSTGVGIASTSVAGVVKVDGKSIRIDEDGVISYDPYKDVDVQTGTFVSTSKADDALAQVNIKGKSTQVVTTQGKNLFDKNITTNILSGMWTDKNASVIGYTATTTSVYVKCKPNTTYVISKVVSQRFSAAYTYELPKEKVVIYGTDSVVSSGVTGREARKMTTDGNAKYIVIYLHKSDVDTLTLQEVLDSLQIEEGEAATSYEPFVPTSPSPDYPAPIVSAQNFDLVSYKDSNMLDITKVNHYSNVSGLTSVINADGSVTVNGTATGNYITILDRDITKLIPMGTYRISDGWTTTTSPQLYCQVRVTDNGTNRYYRNNTFTITEKTTSIGFSLQTGAGSKDVVFNNQIMFPMISRGTSEPSYTPYKEDRINIPLDMGEWNEIKDGEYIQGAVERTFTSNSSWGTLNSSAHIKTTLFQISIVNIDKTSKNIYCNYFKSYMADVLWGNDYEGICISSNNIQVSISLSTLDKYVGETRLIQFGEWLKDMSAKGNPFTVRYKGLTSTTTPLNTYLTSYKGTTNVYTTATPQLEITANFKSQVWSDVYILKKQIEELRALIPMPSTLQKEEPTVMEANAVWYEIDGEITTGGDGASIGNAETTDEPPSTPYWFDPV